jgi:hypothetical protein
MVDLAAIHTRFEALHLLLDERQRRLWAAAEARAIGHGGISRVAAATGLSRTTIRQGLREVPQPDQPATPARPRSRRPGAGRKPLTQRDSSLLPALEALLEPGPAAAPLSPLRWTCKSIRRLVAELRHQGHPVGPRRLAELLHHLQFRLQDTRRARAGALHPDRNPQFAFVNDLAQVFLHNGHHVVSVDARKLLAHRLLTGADPTAVSAPGQALDPDADTATLAVETLDRWCQHRPFPSSSLDVLLLIDTGPTNLAFSQSWLLGLQDWVDETTLRVVVAYFPPGTSQWRQNDHRLVAQAR